MTVYPELVDQNIHNQIEHAGDLKGAVIATNKDNNAICRKTMEIFVTVSSISKFDE